jgi:hypothetical protein
MDIHQNARTTAHSRAELVRWVTAGEGTAGKFGVTKGSKCKHLRALSLLKIPSEAEFERLRESVSNRRS